jgi:hypothetical protein
MNEAIAWEMYLIDRNLNYLIDHCEDKEELASVMTKISRKVFEMVDSNVPDEDEEEEEE